MRLIDGARAGGPWKAAGSLAAIACTACAQLLGIELLDEQAADPLRPCSQDASVDCGKEGLEGSGGLETGGSFGGVSGANGVGGLGGTNGLGGMAGPGGMGGLGSGTNDGGAGGALDTCDELTGTFLCADSFTPRLCVEHSWVDQAACMGDNAYCVNGECVPCLPGQQQCVDNSSATCDPTGSWGIPEACPLSSPPNPSCANGFCAYHAGLDQMGDRADVLYVDYLYGVRVLVTEQTRPYRLGMFGTGTGNNVRMGVYSEGSNLRPDELLTSTTTFATADGPAEAAATPSVTLDAGSHYWLVAIADADIGMRVTTGGTGYALINNPSGWNVLPTPFPSGSEISSSLTPNFYVVLQDY